MIQSTSNESNSTKIDSSLFPVLMDFEQSRILGRTVFSLIQPFEDMQCEKIEEKQGGNNLVKMENDVSFLTKKFDIIEDSTNSLKPDQNIQSNPLEFHGCMSSTNRDQTISEFCTCILNDNDMKQFSEAKQSNEEMSTNQKKKKPRVIPKTESDSVVLKGYQFKFRRIYQNNSRRKVIVCGYEGCNREFTKTWSFLYHARMHEGEKPFACDVCGRSFSQKSNMTKHRRHHFLQTVTDRKLFKCMQCANSYTERYNLRKHLESKHGLKCNRSLTSIQKEDSQSCILISDDEAHKSCYE